MNTTVARTALLSTRGLLRAAGGALATAGVLPKAAKAGALGGVAASGGGGPRDADEAFRWLDGKIRAAMNQFQIPGVAVAAIYNGREFVRGYGVTNLDYPQPVDGDTLFRLGSTTKPFTGATMMRLVEQGLVNLDASVRTYLPSLTLQDESVAASVSVRQLLNHSAGWQGEYYADFGSGADAISRYVAGMAQLPQLTPPGQLFSYNNAAVVLAGRLIEVVTGQAFEDAVQSLVLNPLRLDHTFFNTDSIIGYNVAASHTLEDGQPVVTPSAWRVWRSMFPTGGIITSARDQLRWLRFHVSDGADVDGPPILSPTSVRAMRADIGPGGTIGVEIDGVGVAWWKRATAGGAPVFQNNGDWPGQHAGCFFVPDQDFGLTVLTNSDGGVGLVRALFAADDGALLQFAGLNNPQATPLNRTAAQLAPYVGTYVGDVVDPAPGDVAETRYEIRAADGQLRLRTIKAGAELAELNLAFYRDNYVVALDKQGQPTSTRADFVPGPDGRIRWFRTSRLNERQD